jgi:nucleotide sugar dehydrogenase
MREDDRKKHVGVIGLGRVGLPIALILAKSGYKVFGVDNNVALLQKLRNKEAPYQEPGIAQLIDRYMNEEIKTSDRIGHAVNNSDVILVAIGTHISQDGVPTLDNIYGLVDELGYENLKGRLIIFNTTLPLGTTIKLKDILEERTNLKCGVDFLVAYSPERMVQGKAIKETETLPHIVGGVDTRSQQEAIEFYQTIGNKVVAVENSTAAEFAKLIDNSYRSTIFAFANDVALLAEKYGLNAGEVIWAANDSYPRNNIPFPSCGVSGYCLTKDPLYLESSFESITVERGFPSLWFSGRRTNDYMPVHTSNLTEEALREQGRELRGAEILVCGITYKENVDDIRASHGIDIAEELKQRGANVSVYDPWLAPEVDLGFNRCNEATEAFRHKDAVIFTVKHQQFMEWKGEQLMRLVSSLKNRVIIDGWNMFPEIAGDKRITYRGIGVKALPRIRNESTLWE